MDPTKVLIVIQFVFQLVLMVLVVVLLLRDKKKVDPDPATLELKKLLDKIQNYHEELTHVFQNKSEVISTIMDDLDDKIREAKKVKEKMDAFIVQEHNNSKTYTRQDVLKLSQNGLSPVDIAQATGIPIGEIQLILKVVAQD